MRHVQRQSLPRPPGSFRTQLETLAASYASLETENRELRQALEARGVGAPRTLCKVDADIELDMAIVPVISKDCVHAAPPPSESTVGSPRAHTDSFASVGVFEARTSSAKGALELLSVGEARAPAGDASKVPRRQDPKEAQKKKRMSMMSGFVDPGYRGSTRMSSAARPPVFLDAETMKENVRNQMASSKNQYRPEDYYKETGFAQAIARSAAFESLTLLVIAINALWIWVDTDYNKHDVLIQADPLFQIAENVFCTFFSFEIVVRLFAFSKKRQSLRDSWFVFDLVLVVMMVLETWVLTVVTLLMPSGGGSKGIGEVGPLGMIRMLRLFRMARMVRLLRAIPEFMILIKAIGAALRSVFFCLALLCIFLFSFGVALTQILKDSSIGDTKFQTVLTSMHTLFLNATLMDSTEKLMKAVVAESPISCFIIYIFILVGGITIMNMLIGVLCEVVTCVAATEREVIAVQSVRTTLQRLVDMGVDTDGDGRISKSEFAEMLQTRECVQALQDIGVDAVGLVDLADTIFQTSTEDGNYERTLSFEEFMGVILEMRGSNKATVKDVVDLRKFVAQAFAKTEMRTEKLYKKMVHGPHDGFKAASTDDWRRGSFAGTGSEQTEGRTSRAPSIQSARLPIIEGRPSDKSACVSVADGEDSSLLIIGDPSQSCAGTVRSNGNGNGLAHALADVAEVMEWYDEIEPDDAVKMKSYV